MPEKGSVRKAISDLVAANRIVANEGVLNGFGHVSIRHPAPVAFDDRSLKGLAPQLRDLEIDVPGACLQRPFITASPGILPSLAALVTSSSAKPVRFGIQHGVQRLFLPRTISPRWSRIRASSIWITWPIGFSSIIGSSFIREEAAT